jgi:hypothetical protein
MKQQPVGYLFRSDGSWWLLYYRPKTHVVKVDTVGGTQWDVADLLTQTKGLIVKFADTDQVSWGRTILRDRGLGAVAE